jgi:antitoxin HigA-1
MTLPIPKNKRPPTPGDVLLHDFIKPMHITQLDLAKHLGVTQARLNEIIKGKRTITPDTALRLERVLGPSAGFWLNMQQIVDLYDALHSERAGEIKKLKRLKIAA